MHPTAIYACPTPRVRAPKIALRLRGNGIIGGYRKLDKIGLNLGIHTMEGEIVHDDPPGAAVGLASSVSGFIV